MSEAEPPLSRVDRRIWGPVRWHLLLLVLIVAECLIAAYRHRSSSELLAGVGRASPAEQVEAIFTLNCRNDLTVGSLPDASELVRSKYPLLREWAMTGHFIGFDEPQAQVEYMKSIHDPVEADRYRFLLAFRPGLRQNLRMGVLADFLSSDSRRGDAAR
jgi:hypothetical protein